MAKSRLLGIGNDENYLYAIFKKDKAFFNFLAQLLIAHFDQVNSPLECEGIRKRNPVKFFDHHENRFVSRNSRIDIFYGQKKAFMTVIGKPEIIVEVKGFIKTHSSFLKTNTFIRTKST